MTDPTNVIDSPQRAAVMALALLRLAPEPAAEARQRSAAPVLAALLYAASPQGRGRGINWVYRALTDPVLAGSLAGAVGSDPPAVLAHFDRAEQHRRQIDLITMREAVAPWLHRGHHRAS